MICDLMSFSQLLGLGLSMMAERPKKNLSDSFIRKGTDAAV